MPPQAIHRHPGDEIHIIADADYACGDIVQAGGLAGVVEGLSGVKTGEMMTLRIKGGFDVLVASGTTFADGAAVQWNNSTKLAVASGTFALGKSVGAKVSGTTSMRVLLNE